MFHSRLLAVPQPKQNPGVRRSSFAAAAPRNKIAAKGKGKKRVMSEIILCELRQDCFLVKAFRHQGVVKANAFVLEGFGDAGAFAIDGGGRTFTNKDELCAFAKETILPCFMYKFEQIRNQLEKVQTKACICKISIGGEEPQQLA